MTLWRIFVAILFIAILPTQITIGNEQIIDKKIVDIDDPRVNLPDFEKDKKADEKKTMLATCDEQACVGKPK